MRNFTIYLSMILCLYLTKSNAQDTFEGKAKNIATKIDSITNAEKAALKIEVEAVNVQLASGNITAAQADEQKLALAEIRAKNIERNVAPVQDELNQLIKDRVDGKIKDKDSLTVNFSISTKSGKRKRGETRTTSQFVLAAGLNNVATNKQVAHSDYKIWGSHFYEIGLTSNTRILKNSNLLHAKYGLSVMYNNLRPTENRFLMEDGKQTDLVTSSINLEESRFRVVNLAVPLHLEFDFSKPKMQDDRKVFQSHKGFRFGVGGFAGVNLKAKQILKFEDESGDNIVQKTRTDFNTSDFVYGLSTYIGYRETSLYLKYDLNPFFTNNPIDQNNISLGLRFDLN